MTIRWKPGKEPTKAEIRAAISNAVIRPLDPNDLNKIAEAVHRLYSDRIEGRN